MERPGPLPLSVLPERDPGWPVPHPLQVQDPEGTDVRPAAHTVFCAGPALLGDSPRAGWPGWEGPGDRIMGRAAGGLEIARAARTGCQPASVHGCMWTGQGRGHRLGLNFSGNFLVVTSEDAGAAGAFPLGVLGAHWARWELKHQTGWERC